MPLESRSTSSYTPSPSSYHYSNPLLLTRQAMLWCWSKRWASREYLKLLKLNVLDLTQISQSLSVYRVSKQNCTRYNLYPGSSVPTMSGKWLRSCVGADSVGWRGSYGPIYLWLTGCWPLPPFFVRVWHFLSLFR